MSDANVLVFAYGSLLDPPSLVATLPSVDLAACVPARLRGYERAFNVAFPNDGRESDKAYFDGQGRRPSFVLFWDVIPRPEAMTNGICIPAGEPELLALRNRELRYRLVELTGVTPYDGWQVPAGTTILGFLAKPEYARAGDVSAGLVPRAYLDQTLRGARYWDLHAPGFLADFQAGTASPDPSRVADLDRQDAPVGS